MNRDEIKIELIKKILNVNNWYVKGDLFKYPFCYWILDGTGIPMLEFNNKKANLSVSPHCNKTIKKILGLGEEEVGQLMKIISLNQGYVSKGNLFTINDRYSGSTYMWNYIELINNWRK